MTAVIETARLRLREWRLTDFDAYAALRTDADLQRYSGGARTPAQAWEEFCAAPGQWALLGYGVFLVADRTHDRPLGFAGLWHPPDLQEPELCWSLFPGNTGHGYATEAAAAALCWCCGERALPAPMSFVHADNHASRAVAQRLGASVVTETRFRGSPRLFYRHRSAPLAD